MLACIPRIWAARRRTGGERALEPGAKKPAARLACWCCLPCCLLVLAAGCSRTRHSVEHVEVTGRVLYKNKPLQGGQLTFVTADGFASSGIIDEKGNYTISAPVGNVRISVDNRMVGQKLIEAASKGAGRPESEPPSPIKGVYREIPGKYYTLDTSGLTYTVTSGPQTHDITLTD